MFYFVYFGINESNNPTFHFCCRDMLYAICNGRFQIDGSQICNINIRIKMSMGWSINNLFVINGYLLELKGGSILCIIVLDLA